MINSGTAFFRFVPDHSLSDTENEFDKTNSLRYTTDRHLFCEGIAYEERQ